MRIAMIFVAAVAIAAPSQASSSCLGKGEARHHFGQVHIYWHGPDHCWDATPTRHHQVARAERRAEPAKPQPTEEPPWREARSEMLAGSQPVRLPREPPDRPGAAVDKAAWSDRWVDVVQVAPLDLRIEQPHPVAATTALGHGIDATIVGHAFTLLAFGTGLVIVFVTILVRAGGSSPRPWRDDHQT